MPCIPQQSRSRVGMQRNGNRVCVPTFGAWERGNPENNKQQPSKARNMVNKQEIEKRLKGKPNKQIAIFAARCALRALSYLPIKDGKISGWHKDKAGLHVFSVFRAVNASLFLAESLSSSKEIFVAKAVAKAAASILV